MRYVLFLILSGPVFAQSHWITPDFFISENSEQSFHTPYAKTDPKKCRAEISKKVCLVDPELIGEPGSDRPCLEGGERYAHYFEEIFDVYPKPLQRIFCSLKAIYLEKKFIGTAYGGLVNGKAVIGIRQSVLDEALTLQAWASWKEQLSFGGLTDSYELTPGLPFIRTRSAGKISDFLFFVIAHEFGHIFDFANHLNGSPSDPEKSDLRIKPESWGSLSWLTSETPLPENDFPNRRNLCFYSCAGKIIPKEEIRSTYRDLYYGTNFISAYATTQPWDDFADSLAYYLLHTRLSSRYELFTQDGGHHNAMHKLRSPEFYAKYSFLEKFLARQDIHYP